jgi:hypothetical protein
VSGRGLIAPMLALCLVVVAAACATSTAAVFDTSPASAAPDTTSKTVMLVVNPSARARSLAFEHAAEIIGGGATFNLTLLGIYEQPAGVRKPPFNRPFISDSVPSVGAPPTRPTLHDCSHLDTEYQKKKCKRDNERAVTDYNDAVRRWKNDNGAVLAGWKSRTSRALRHLAKNGPTEEAPGNSWDLRAAFLQIGQDLKALETTRNCVVILGGVAVRTPPAHLRADLLKGATVIIPGWTGTQKVQDLWSQRLSSAGANAVILPQAVTDLRLVPTVAGCLQGTL